MIFKDIHIGQMMKTKVTESGIEISRICNFLKCSEEHISEMYESKSLDTELLLKWSKLLDYDFFRVYTQHLILYAPPSARTENDKIKSKKSALPQFRKNIYTKEIIDFILERMENGEMTKNQVIEQYGIPKTTLYKWIDKYKNFKNT
ncbi:helix-turn-helix domain-containing protein [Chryseobacterium sp. POL2]|uniref:helix-turn-helix domain-containing protein n=1 Tax=Chryseobacterium sp. POL2 TaxID=2713414 RepID=UPI0013E165A9|nr:helix-turn-helix domain-containing protein [Chryseobacterium sp. POL2]QIG89339.1 helix-turn-helix domain-containing protein [Chryseobacterium sp. POL2]